MRLYCYYCEYDGKAERGLAQRPSNRKIKICPSCRADAHQQDWWEEEVEAYDETDPSCSD